MALYKKHSAQAIDNACINNTAFIYSFFNSIHDNRQTEQDDLVSQGGIKHLIYRYKN